VIREAEDATDTTLVCLAYAGGNPESFRGWADDLDAGIGLLAVRLPGHGLRLREPLYRDWRPLVEDTFAALAPHLSGRHAFFGHSFGGRLAYELAHLAAAEYPGRTRRLMVAGCRSPDRPNALPLMHEMDEERFRAALADMGGMPAELLADASLMRVVSPVVRGEIALAEVWGDRHGAGVDVPITALCGREDPIDDLASMRGWAAFGGRDCELVELPGGHFFLDTHRRDLLEVVNTRLGARSGPVGM
jgi:surfactin synthase thioesterase subunit